VWRSLYIWLRRKPRLAGDCFTRPGYEPEAADKANPEAEDVSEESK